MQVIYNEPIDHRGLFPVLVDIYFLLTCYADFSNEQIADGLVSLLLGDANEMSFGDFIVIVRHDEVFLIFNRPVR